jgi:sugar O-acyltransferase (sialic acid O-acetyltransferase NeuD family)
MSQAEAMLVVGAGGFGQSVADALLVDGRYRLAGFVDDRGAALGIVLGHAVLGGLADLATLRRQYGLLAVALGDNTRRREVFQLACDLDFALPAVVHPRAWISRHARIGEGAAIMAGAIVGTAATIGRGALVNAAAVVDHHACVEDFAHLGIGACMASGSRLGSGAWLQEGAVLRAGHQVAANTVATRLDP